MIKFKAGYCSLSIDVIKPDPQYSYVAIIEKDKKPAREVIGHGHLFVVFKDFWDGGTILLKVEQTNLGTGEVSEIFEQEIYLPSLMLTLSGYSLPENIRRIKMQENGLLVLREIENEINDLSTLRSELIKYLKE